MQNALTDKNCLENNDLPAEIDCFKYVIACALVFFFYLKSQIEPDVKQMSSDPSLLRVQLREYEDALEDLRSVNDCKI